MQTSDHWTLPILGSISCFNCSFNWTTVSNWWFCSAGNQMKKNSWRSTNEINEHCFIISKFELFQTYTYIWAILFWLGQKLYFQLYSSFCRYFSEIFLFVVYEMIPLKTFWGIFFETLDCHPHWLYLENKSKVFLYFDFKVFSIKESTKNIVILIILTLCI